MRTINPLILTMESTDNIKKQEEANQTRIKIEEMERLAKIREKENESLRQQLKAK